MADFRVGCIGAGYFSQFHYDAWARIKGARVVASVDQDLPRAQATGAAPYSDIAEMIGAEQPDIVDIITPPPTHFEAIKAAMKGNPRAIICQKPFCTDLAEARAAATLADQQNIPLIVHENFRFQPWYRVIKSALDDGQIGKVAQVTFRLRPGDGQGPEAYLDRQPYFQRMQRFLVHETAVHWVDTFRFLLGDPDRVFAELRQENAVIAGEDAGYILFAYSGGARALFDGNRLLDHAASNTRATMGEALIEGLEGTITLSGDGSVRLRAFGQQGARMILAPSAHDGFGGDCVYHLQSHVVDALNGQRAFENEAKDYLAIVETEIAIYRAAELGQWVSL